MKLQVEEVTMQEIEYPVLMKDVNSSLVVLFANQTEGTVAVSGKGLYNVGYHQDDWYDADDDTEWTKFQGVIKLSND